MTSRLDPVLEIVLDQMTSESAAQAQADINAGKTDSRMVWGLLGLDRQVQSFDDLTPLIDTEPVSALRFVVDDDQFYELLADNEGVKSWEPIFSPNGILFEYERVHGHFSRQECEKRYEEQYNEETGLVSRMIAAKLQSDVVSGVDRDFCSRHRTALRSRLHGAAMRQVAGDGKGTVNAVRRYLGTFMSEIDEKQIKSSGVPTVPERTTSG